MFQEGLFSHKFLEGINDVAIMVELVGPYIPLLRMKTPPLQRIMSFKHRRCCLRKILSFAAGSQLIAPFIQFLILLFQVIAEGCLTGSIKNSPIIQHAEYRIPVGLAFYQKITRTRLMPRRHFKDSFIHQLLEFHLTLNARRLLAHSLHRYQRVLIAMLAPLLHVIYPAVHNHQYDAREQLEHHLARHTLIEYLAEEIYRVGLERGIERIWEGIELLFYGVQLVFIVVGARLLLLDGDRRIYEERLGCTLTISGNW